MYMWSSPTSLVLISSLAGTGVRWCVMSTTGVPLRQLAGGALVGMSCASDDENNSSSDRVKAHVLAVHSGL